MELLLGNSSSGIIEAASLELPAVNVGIRQRGRERGRNVLDADPGLAKQIRALRNHGRNQDDGWLEHRLPGYNYRLSEINCALGVAQMSRLPEILKRREAAAARYSTELLGNPK